MKSVVCWFVVLAVSFPNLVWAVDVTPIKSGEKAIYSGLLVSEGRFAKMLEAELTVKELDARIEIQENLTASLEEMYTKRLREATKALPWYETPSANRWFGFTLGVAFTSLIVYASSYFVKAID